MPDLEEEEVKSVTFPLFFHHPPQPPHTLPQDKEQFVFPGKHVPTYALGWMIKVPHITDFGNRYGSYQERFILPRWKAEGFPDWDSNPREHGLMVPKLSLFGPDHILIQIAENTPQAIEFLKTEANTNQLVEQALKVLLLDETEPDFGAYRNLIWLLTPWYWYHRPEVQGRTVEYPCIGHIDREMPGEMKDIVDYAWV